jgi:hypothetical protein
VADHKEVNFERFYVRVPGTENLRRNAAGRLRHLLATGWRETERWIETDYIRVRLERSGHAPLMTRIPKPPPPQARPPRQGGFRQGGFRQGGPPRQGGAPRPS